MAHASQHTLTIPARGKGRCRALTRWPRDVARKEDRRLRDSLPPGQGSRIWGSPTPSPLRGATSPPSEGEERCPVRQAHALPLPRCSGERWSATPTGVGSCSLRDCATTSARTLSRSYSLASRRHQLAEIGACGMPSPCGVGQGGGARASQRLPAVDLPAVASDGMPSFAKLRAGEKDRQEISPPYLHLVACVPHRPRGAGDRGTARHSRPMNWRRGCGNITPAALEDQGHDRSWEAALPCSGTRG